MPNRHTEVARGCLHATVVRGNGGIPSVVAGLERRVRHLWGTAEIPPKCRENGVSHRAATSDNVSYVRLDGGKSAGNTTAVAHNFPARSSSLSRRHRRPLPPRISCHRLPTRQSRPSSRQPQPPATAAARPHGHWSQDDIRMAMAAPAETTAPGSTGHPKGPLAKTNPAAWEN